MSKTRKSLAKKADKFELYLRSVQEPEHEVWFFDKLFRAEFGRLPVTLREDFCGAAAICCEWVKRKHPTQPRRAIGVDLDEEVLAWGQEHLASKLSAEQSRRVTLLQKDVREITPEKAEIVAAQNFSYWIFKTRDALRGYFHAARENLAAEGMMVLDMMGGSELLEPRTDRKRYRGFTYIWEHQRFDPITHDADFAIHFEFADGSAIRNAFEYHWRMWTLPEVKELLLEAGFSRVDVYWEGEDRKTGKGNGVYRRRSEGTPDPSWVTYVVGIR